MDALLLTRPSWSHPSWPPTPSSTAVHASRGAGSSSAPKYARAIMRGSKWRTRAASGPAIAPGMAGPTDWRSSGPSLETAAGVSAAMPSSAGWHGPGLAGPGSERQCPLFRACRGSGTRRTQGQRAGKRRRRPLSSGYGYSSSQRVMAIGFGLPIQGPDQLSGGCQAGLGSPSGDCLRGNSG
jgi:hypothetical protein